MNRLTYHLLKVLDKILSVLTCPINSGVLWYLQLSHRQKQLQLPLRKFKFPKVKLPSLTKLTSPVRIRNLRDESRQYRKSITSNVKYWFIWNKKELEHKLKRLLRSLPIWITKLSKFHKLLNFNNSSIRQFVNIRKPKDKKPNGHKKTVSVNSKRSLLSSPRLAAVALTLAILMTIGNTGYAFYYYVLRDLPSPERLTSDPLPQTTKILDRNGTLLYKIYGRQNRTWITLDEIPQSVIDATLSIEDRNFYNHSGFSFTGIARAAIAQARGESLQGGSTLTQQLIKNTLLTPERTWSRKIKEFILAIETEKRYSKDQILEMYLNVVGYGGQAYGIEAAAEQYFGIPAKDLTLSQAAMLAGLTASPTTYSPLGAHPEMAEVRRLAVLGRMFEDKKVTLEELETAQSDKPVIAAQTTFIKAPHFVMWVRELLAQKYGEDVVASGGLTVITSLDLPTEEMVEIEIIKQLALLQYQNVGNGAAIVVKTETGEVLAMAGSKNYFDTKNDGNVNVALALRQPGSSIKVVTYAAALEDGYKPSTVIGDSPISYPAVGGPTYTPVNYDGKFHGPVTLRTALACSYNIPAVKTLATLGIPKVVTEGINLGLSSWQKVLASEPGRFGLSLTLGGVEVKMTEMMEVYATIGHSGQKVTLNPILTVTDSRGDLLEDNRKSVAGTQIIKPATSFMLSKILSDNTARTPAFGPNSVLNIPGYEVAVKTGTTNDLRDNWTFGYTPTYTVGTWVGNNDNSRMSAVASGITGASPIWSNVMKNILDKNPKESFITPSDMVAVKVCGLTGTLECNACPGELTYFAKGTEPTTSCNDAVINKIREDQKKKSVDQ